MTAHAPALVETVAEALRLAHYRLVGGSTDVRVDPGEVLARAAMEAITDCAKHEIVERAQLWATDAQVALDTGFRPIVVGDEVVQLVRDLAALLAAPLTVPESEIP